MTHQEIAQRMLDAIHKVGGIVSVIYKDFDTGAIPFQFAPDYVMDAAEMAKIPILLATLMRVEEGTMRLDQCVLVPDLWITPDSTAFERGAMSYSIDELLAWMIVANEDTAANVLIELLGFDYINRCCQHFGMVHTSLASHIGNTKIPDSGRGNVTCAQDMLMFFERIYRNEGLSRPLCEYAGRLFLRYRRHDGFTRYNSDDIYTGRMSGEWFHVSHEAGIFYLRYVDFFLAVFATDTAGTPGSKLELQRMRGRMADMIYNYYLEREDAIRQLPYDPSAPYGENRY